LDNLTSVTDSLSISFNDSLANLNGLAALQSIGGGLLITEDSLLVSLDGLGSLNSIGGPIAITDNAALTTCATTKFCAILKTKSVDDVLIENNIGDCETREAVDAACVALPVTLISFTARKEGRMAVLEWSTSAETNSDYFEIQYSNGKSWVVVGKMIAAGESAVVRPYSFTHSNPQKGSNLYRLKMVDRAADGADKDFAFSSIQAVRFDDLPVLEIYPNPVAANLIVRSANGTIKEIALYNAAGVCVAVKSLDTMDLPEPATIDTSELPGGMYVAKVAYVDGAVHTGRFVKK